jgi:hypothetical protein
MSQMFDQASSSFSRTFETSMKFYQDSTRFWSDACTKGMDNWRTQSDRVVGDTAPFGQANFERFQRMFTEQSEKSMNLLREAFEASQSTRPADLNQRVSDLWKNSFETLRNANETLAKANEEMVQNWTKMCETVSQNANQNANQAKSTGRNK